MNNAQAIDVIRTLITQVQTLDLTPIEAVNRIAATLTHVQQEEETHGNTR
jgi:hypothetical protein